MPCEILFITKPSNQFARAVPITTKKRITIYFIIRLKSTSPFPIMQSTALPVIMGAVRVSATAAAARINAITTRSA